MDSEKLELMNYDNFINRELSWLEFNQRVLEEARDKNNPLLERMKFLAIVSSNLDEFYMVRVASLYDKVKAQFEKPDFSGLIPSAQVDLISKRVQRMVYNQYNCYYKSIMKCLKKYNVNILKIDQLNNNQLNYLEEYYTKSIFPVLTPMVVDNSRPFPLILNKTLNIALLLKGKEGEKVFATIQVPSVLKRIIELPCENNENCFILLEDIIKIHLKSLFYGHEIIAMGCYRVTRSSDLNIDEEEAEDLLEEIQESLKKRKWGHAVRLEVENNINEELLNILIKEFHTPSEGVLKILGPIDLTFLMKISSIKGFEQLKFEPFEPKMCSRLLEEEDIFTAISEGDIFLSHPYDSFEPIIKLVKKAAVDPNVLAIKQTLYRVSGKSPIIEALAQAAENGKQVTVLVELKARFDEENNIQWAKRLEMSGCHVIYGLVGLKTHCKVLLVVRQEEDGIKRYVHMGTGNYNDVTAKLYTDMGILTANPYFGEDASILFNMLSGYSKKTEMNKIYMAPINLRAKFTSLINREIENAKQGKKAKIIAKMNSLVDEKIILKLYEASNSGVEIELIVRGVCCLRPKVKGVSENISVRSIVGRFLEHSRIYYFYNDGMEEIYLSSADWMGRNLDRRVETCFPVEDKTIMGSIKEILDIYLKDTLKAKILNSSGIYLKVDKRGKEIINSQEFLSNLSNNSKRNFKVLRNKDEFIPKYSNL